MLKCLISKKIFRIEGNNSIAYRLTYGHAKNRRTDKVCTGKLSITPNGFQRRKTPLSGYGDDPLCFTKRNRRARIDRWTVKAFASVLVIITIIITKK